MNTLRVSNCLNPDQDRHSVGPDLGFNCLQRLSADDKVTPSKERGVTLCMKNTWAKVQNFQNPEL